MMGNFLGSDWLVDQAGKLTDKVTYVSPVDFNEENRYMPDSVTAFPGFIRFDLTPFLREIINCFDVRSPVREVTVKKGTQIGYTTALESLYFYAIGHVKGLPMMYVTLDREMSKSRIDNNFLPMLQHSGMADLIETHDTKSKRKTGQTKDYLQFTGGSYLVPIGAQSANKFRSFSIWFMGKDEMDPWPDLKDGDPDTASDKRCSGYWDQRKIFRASTPLFEGTSRVQKAYNKGDQRKYLVLCKSCSYAQELRWKPKQIVQNKRGGFKWELSEKGVLVLESVRYECNNCEHAHYERDKQKLFAEESGAHWKATAEPEQPNIRSYHIPAFFSPIYPWSQCVLSWLAAFAPEEERVKDVNELQTFYNTVLGEPFQKRESKLKFHQLSAHRRRFYQLGQIPNLHVKEYCGAPILFLTCSVDVQKNFLSVAIFGWTRKSICWLIDYDEIRVEEGDDTADVMTSPVWLRLQDIIDGREYVADDGKKYGIVCTLIDSSYAHATVIAFCNQWDDIVLPILGRDRASRHQEIKEFAEFTTQLGTVGYRITVDNYKDRLQPVLKKTWLDQDVQSDYTFNAPIDLPDKALNELMVEYRMEKIDERGHVYYPWIRPGNARNELWDLLVYGHAAVEITAWRLCIQYWELEKVEWDGFWGFLEEEAFYFDPPE